MDDGTTKSNPWEAVCEAMVTHVLRALQVIYDDFNVSLERWLNDMVSHPIAENWHDEVAAFVDETERKGLRVLPDSIRVIEALIESRIAGTGQFAQFGPAPRASATGGNKTRNQNVAVRTSLDTDETPKAESPQHRGLDHQFILVADKPRAKSSYRKAFKEATPAMPDRFEVHHIFEKGREILAERFRKELNTDLNDLDNLRGLSKETHGEISAIQAKFWAAKAAELELNISGEGYDELYERVSLAEVQKLQAEIEATYKSFWVKSGATAEEVAAVEKRLNNKRLMNLRPARIEGTLKNAGLAVTGFAIFTFLADAAALANNIANPSPEVQSALDEMLAQYARLYDIRSAQGSINRKQWAKLQDATMNYLKLAGFDDKTKAAILYKLELEGSKLP